MNEETTNKAIVEFRLSIFQNDIQTKSLSTDTFITTSKTQACKQQTEDEYFRQL